ncbi:MAG: nucleotide exchange factor GrpE [Patescibacteria group bacterium]
MKEKNKKKVENIEQEFEEIKTLLQRTQADFINHRRRVEEDKANFVKLASADVISQVLPVLDNFRLAARHVPENLKNDNWVMGVQAIEKQLEQVLCANGLEKIDTKGQQFDPSLHEAISEVSDKKFKDNEIVSENMAGYLLNGKLIRPAKVIVNHIKK